MTHTHLTYGIVLALALGGATTAAGQTAHDLRRLSLEELMNIEVTSVTRQPEPAGSAAAAVSVITREDIRRAGVTTIADALALADGVDVARFNNGSWSISARGFNGSTPNKLLVMVDGRNVFTPLFSGVFWNMLDYVLEDLDRIEVIRGPGAALWGANAVNGVVNIITRHTRETRGTFVALGSGNEDPGLVEVRHGGGSDAVNYRVYGKFAQRDAQQFSTGGSSEDSRRRGQAGMRLDAVRGTNEWLVTADAFHSREDFIDRRDGEFTGVAVQARLHKKLSDRSSAQIQSYYRREYRNIALQLTHYLDTIDVDFQHAVQVGARHNFIAGGAYRVNHDRTFGSAVIHFDPANRTYPVASAFAQDEVAVGHDVSVIVGARLEHNAFSSGVDLQPNVRGRWLLPSRQMVWGAVSRAVRRPTRFDDDIVVTTPTGLVLAQGSEDFRPESMIGWEAGYRAQPISVLSVDATVFIQHYDRLRSQEAPLIGLVPVTIGNTLNGQSQGVELSVKLLPGGRWRAQGGYTFVRTDITRDADSHDVSGGVSETNDPHHLFTVRGGIDLTRRVQADAWLRSVSARPDPAVPGYTELGARMGFGHSDRAEFALIGQDLLHDHHPEFGTSVPRRIEFERSLRAVLTLRLP